MRNHPTTGETPQAAAARILQLCKGNREDAQEIITGEIAYTVSEFEREFWQNVLSYI